MKILLSSYSCRPNFGSEHAVGWNFAEQLALQGNTVTVLTNDECRPYIEGYSNSISSNLSFVYYRLPLWIKKHLYRGVGPLAHIYYFFWQIGAYFFLKGFLKNNPVDLIHQITLGVFRTPVFLGLLKYPFVLGPVGGGESSTPELQRELPLKFRLREILRHWSNLSALINPLMYVTYLATDLILLKTRDNLKYIPTSFHHKCRLSLEIGISKGISYAKPVAAVKEDKTFKILFAGRLEYWKGVHLAIKAFAALLKQQNSISFTIVGSGTDENWIKSIASRQNVSEHIEWLPRVSQEKLFQMYREYDILLFPSLHDSSGGVVIEALYFGLPVVCLDLGGPKEIVDADCGIIIDTNNRSEKAVVHALVSAVNNLAAKPELLAKMSANGMEKALAFSWGKVVERNYTIINESLGESLAYKQVQYEAGV